MGSSEGADESHEMSEETEPDILESLIIGTEEELMKKPWNGSVTEVK